MRTHSAAARRNDLSRIVALVPFLLVLTPPLLAQVSFDGTRPRVEVGSTIRFERSDSVVQGSIVQVDAAGWKVELDGVDREPLEITPNSGTRVEVRTGRETKVLKGAGIGALAGAFSGALIGSSTWKEPVGGCWFDCDPGSHAAVTAVGVGILGMIGGAIIGAFPRDRWEEITPPGDVQISPRTGGGVALSGSLGL